jgi:deoxyribodipyrimidine photo-lyase
MVDFMLGTLALMQAELKKLDIPLVFLQADERAITVPTVVKFLNDHSISHLFANYEYEVDEVRQDAKFLNQVDFRVHVSLYHDQTVVEPGTTLTGNRKPMKVFTPYHQAWLAKVKANPYLLATVPAAETGDVAASMDLKSLFDSKVPGPARINRSSRPTSVTEYGKLWPASHNAGMKRMHEFIKKIGDSAATRSKPAADSTSRMSACFSAGVVSVREALGKVKEYNGGSSDFKCVRIRCRCCSMGLRNCIPRVVTPDYSYGSTYWHEYATEPQTRLCKWETDEERWKK